MKRFIALATVVALSAFLPCAVLAQSNKVSSPASQSLQAEVKKALEAGGFKDVRVDPQTFVVEAKDSSGSPVTILINPNSFESAAALTEASSSENAAGQRAEQSENEFDEQPTGSLGTINGYDKTVLTPGQKQVVWDNLSSEKTMRANRPNSYAPRVGAIVPNSVFVQPLPDEVTSNAPYLAGYEYTVARNEIVIVSPVSRRVVDIIEEQ
jgi:hypothetical protein